jgi:hypothetical protein
VEEARSGVLKRITEQLEIEHIQGKPEAMMMESGQ